VNRIIPVCNFQLDRLEAAQNAGTGAGYFIDITLKNSQEGWAVGEFGMILHTVDGGSHWTPQSSGISTELEAVVFTDYLMGGPWATAASFATP